jgi:RimJ/RimL family protein N-acetyltransferase
VPILAHRLVLEPLRIEDADEMAPVFDDPQLHVFTGGVPLTPDQLRDRYRRLEPGRSADGSQSWLNWIVRLRDGRRPVGTVQATVTGDDDRMIARLAWTIGARHQRQGYATEAGGAMAEWLRDRGVTMLVADIHPDHAASSSVARALGLAPTDLLVGGEIRWSG